MHLRNIWAIIILSLCMVPAFGQGALIKGLEQARTIASLTERIAYLRNLNPTVPISTIKSAAKGLTVVSTSSKLPNLSTPPVPTSALTSKIPMPPPSQDLSALSPVRRTPQEWLTRYTENPEEFRAGTSMYHAFKYQFSRVKSGKDVDEYSLKMAQIYRENTKQFKSPEDWLKEYEEHPEQFAYETPLYLAFLRITRRVEATRAAGKEVDDASLKIYHIYRENTRQNKSPEAWLEEYEKHPEQLTQGTVMYQAFADKTYRVETAQKEGKPVDEFSLRMAQIFRENTRQLNTPEKWLQRYAENPEQFFHGSAMYRAFQYQRIRVREAQAAGEEVSEAALQMAQIYEENTKRVKTPVEWLEEYAKHPEQLVPQTAMYSAFRDQNRRVKTIQAAGKEVDEFSLKMAQIYQENISHPDTLPEVYNMLLTYLRTNRAYPLSRSVEYQKVRVRFRNKSLVEIKANPDLYKLYRLDQLARAVRRGEKPWEVFDQDNPLRRKRRGEQQGEESPKELEEAYTQLSQDEQQVLRQTEEYYDQLWQNYPVWFEENKGNIIFTRLTTAAFDLLNKQVAAGRSSEEIISTLDMLQQLSLGNVGDGVFNRVIYRGNNATLTPRAEDFHLVIEEQGLPSLPHIRQMFPQEVPHVYFKFMDGKISVMGLTTGVTPQDIETAIDTLLEHISQNAQVSNASDGWRIRMGKHEMSDKPHIHFEFVDGEEGMDLSYVLRLDVRGVIPEEKNARKKTFEYLFGKYIER